MGVPPKHPALGVSPSIQPPKYANVGFGHTLSNMMGNPQKQTPWLRAR